MFLNRINVRIALTFTLFSTIVSIIIFSALSLIINGFLKNEDIQKMSFKLQELEYKYNIGGLDHILSSVDVSNMHLDGRSYFIRMQKKHNVFDISPSFWKKDYDFTELNDRGKGELISINSEKHEFNLDVLTYVTVDGTILQVGVSDQLRREFSNVLQKVFVILLVPLVIISMVFGLYYSRRTLKPVLDLTETIKGIIKTGLRPESNTYKKDDNELGELVTLFNTLFDKNENLIKGMKETLDNVSHDLRTPLTRIRCTSEVALTSFNVDSLRDAHSDCIEEIDSIIKILNALLDITASENGVLNLDIQEFNLRELLNRSVELYDFVAEDKMIKLLLKYELDSDFICADEIKLRQAVANVLDNAVKYSDKGGVINILVSKEDGKVVFIIKDSGIGISADELNNIWDRLFRSTRSRNEPGLGLGLSMVKAIIVAHGGTVEVKSKLNIGSTFILSIPLTKK